MLKLKSVWELHYLLRYRIILLEDHIWSYGFKKKIDLKNEITMKASMINHFRYCLNHDFEVFHQK